MTRRTCCSPPAARVSRKAWSTRTSPGRTTASPQALEIADTRPGEVFRARRPADPLHPDLRDAPRSCAAAPTSCCRGLEVEPAARGDRNATASPPRPSSRRSSTCCWTTRGGAMADLSSLQTMIYAGSPDRTGPATRGPGRLRAGLRADLRRHRTRVRLLPAARRTTRPAPVPTSDGSPPPGRPLPYVKVSIQDEHDRPLSGGRDRRDLLQAAGTDARLRRQPRAHRRGPCGTGGCTPAT